MSYKELLERYREGSLDDSTRRQVEADIEKQDAISDYLCDTADIPGLEELALPDPLPEEDAGFADAIQRSIHRAFVKLGIVVGVSVLAVTLAAIFVLPKIVDQFFYDPNEVAGVNAENPDLTTSKMSLDLAVWSELFNPGRYRNHVVATPRGYGTYDIAIHQNISADGRFETVVGQLVRNDLRLYDPNLLRLPAGNAFTLPEECKDFYTSTYAENEATGEMEPVSRAQERAWAFEHLQDLPQDLPRIACISLEEITDYADFYAWFDSHELGVYDAWAGIYAEDEWGNWVTQGMGVSISYAGVCLDWDRERYPALSMLSNGDEERDPSDVQLMTRHFLDLTRYLEVNPELLELFGRPNGIIQADAIFADTEANGLRVYGLALVATPEELMKLESDPAVSNISTIPY